MRRILSALILSIFITLGTTAPASAWLLMKLSNMAEDVTTTVTKIGKKAQNLLDKAGNWTVVKTIGKGFAEARTWIKNNVSKLKSFADEVKADVDAYKKIYAESKKIYDENMGGYLKVAADIKALQASYDSIQLKIKEVETSFKAQIEAQKTTISGQIDACTENMSNLKKLIDENSIDKEAYEKEYNQWNEKQKQLVKQIDDLDVVAQKELDSMLNTYKNELSTVKSQLSQLKADLSKLAGLSDEEQSDEDALLNTANLYFLQYDEELSPKRQDAIRYNRLKERRESIINGYSKALSKIPEYVTKDDETEDLGYNGSTMDTTAGAWGVAAQLQIDNVKALSTLAHLLVYDLKRQTAVEMSNLTFYKLQKEQKNIAEFTLDDYVYKKKGGNK